MKRQSVLVHSGYLVNLILHNVWKELGDRCTQALLTNTLVLNELIYHIHKSDVGVWYFSLCAGWNRRYSIFCHKGHLQYVWFFFFFLFSYFSCMAECVHVRTIEAPLLLHQSLMLVVRCSIIHINFRLSSCVECVFKIDLNTVICSADFVFNWF